MSTYTLAVTLPTDPADAERRVRDALQDQGFGILSEIDVEAALRDKLGVEIGTYRILGACNPSLARQAIEMDADIGALLPCNVVIRASTDGGTDVVTDVVAADPEAMLSVGPDALGPLAKDARQRLDAALAALAAGA